MNQIIRRLGLLGLFAITLVARANAQGGSVAPRDGVKLRDLIIEDSLTEGKKLLRDYVAQLRDTLVGVEAVQSRLVRARAAKMSAVVSSQGRELARACLASAAMVDLTSTRIAPMGTPNPQGDQAMHAYRAALTTLREDLRLCAHYDSTTMAARPRDDQKLENIATAAGDAISRYDLIRDGLMKLFGITLPIHGKIHH